MKALQASLLLFLLLNDSVRVKSECVISLPDDLGETKSDIKNAPLILSNDGQILYPESDNKITIDKGATIKLKCTSNLVRKSDKLNYIKIRKGEKPAYPIDTDFINLKCQGGKKFVGKKFEPQEKAEKPKKTDKDCVPGKVQKPPKDEVTRTKRADQGSSNDANSEIEYLISDVTCTVYPKSTYIDKKNNEMCGTNKLKEIAFRISDQQTVGVIDICRINDEIDIEYTAWAHSKILPLIPYASGMSPGFSVIDSKIFDLGNLVSEMNKNIPKLLNEEGNENFKPELFDRGHLVPKMDKYHSDEQFATFNYANVVPMWAPVNKDNWEAIEQIARRITRNRKKVLDEWVGSMEIMMHNGLRVILKTEKILTPSDARKFTKSLPVPLYTYKILLDNIPDGNDSNKKEGIVFITINNPYLTVSECLPLVKCHDVLDHIPLEYFEDPFKTGDGGDHTGYQDSISIENPMKWDNAKEIRDRMKNPSHGYTFACTIEDFREAFPNNPLGVTFGQTKLMSIPDMKKDEPETP